MDGFMALCGAYRLMSPETWIVDSLIELRMG